MKQKSPFSVHISYFNILGSWANVPRGNTGQGLATPADLTNSEIMTKPVVKFEVVSARTVNQNNEKKHVVSLMTEM
jgi:hypothetical protein